MSKHPNLVARVLRSIFFKNAENTAQSTAGNKNQILELLMKALKKSQGGEGSVLQKIRNHIFLLGRMLRAYASGEYRMLPTKSLMLIVTVLVYFVSPIDLIPDFLPLLGLTDDFALMLWLFRTISQDINAYKIWEQQQSVSIK